MNEFPLDYFPKQVRDYIIECTKEGGLVHDYLCGSGLSVLSALIGNNIKIKVSSNQIESSMLWTALVGGSGTRKTPSINVMLKPLEEIDAISHVKYKNELKNQKEDDSLPDPRFKQRIVDDVTTESMLDVMKFNEKGLLMKKDELLDLLNDGSRYNNGGGSESKLLSIYSQSSITINRKKNKEVTLISNPFLSLIGGIQPALVKELFKKDREHSGFVNRILFVKPQEIIMKLPTGNFNERVKEEYYNYIKDVHSRLDQMDTTHNVVLSYKASNKYRKWAQEFILNSINESDLHQTIKATLSKLDAISLRIALIIECSHEIYNGTLPNEISSTSMQGGIEIAEYFYLNFLDIFNTQQPEKPVDKKEFECQKAFIQNTIPLINKPAQVSSLLNQGFPNSIISRTLGIPKSTISGYSGG